MFRILLLLIFIIRKAISSTFDELDLTSDIDKTEKSFDGQVDLIIKEIDLKIAHLFGDDYNLITYKLNRKNKNEGAANSMTHFRQCFHEQNILEPYSPSEKKEEESNRLIAGKKFKNEKQEKQENRMKREKKKKSKSKRGKSGSSHTNNSANYGSEYTFNKSSIVRKIGSVIEFVSSGEFASNGEIKPSLNDAESANQPILLNESNILHELKRVMAKKPLDDTSAMYLLFWSTIYQSNAVRLLDSYCENLILEEMKIDNSMFSAAVDYEMMLEGVTLMHATEILLVCVPKATKGYEMWKFFFIAFSKLPEDEKHLTTMKGYLISHLLEIEAKDVFIRKLTEEYVSLDCNGDSNQYAVKEVLYSIAKVLIFRGELPVFAEFRDLFIKLVSRLIHNDWNDLMGEIMAQVMFSSSRWKEIFRIAAIESKEEILMMILSRFPSGEDFIEYFQYLTEIAKETLEKTGKILKLTVFKLLKKDLYESVRTKFVNDETLSENNEPISYMITFEQYMNKYFSTVESLSSSKFKTFLLIMFNFLQPYDFFNFITFHAFNKKETNFDWLQYVHKVIETWAIVKEVDFDKQLIQIVKGFYLFEAGTIDYWPDFAETLAAFDRIPKQLKPLPIVIERTLSFTEIKHPDFSLFKKRSSKSLVEQFTLVEYNLFHKIPIYEFFYSNSVIGPQTKILVDWMNGSTYTFAHAIIKDKHLFPYFLKLVATAYDIGNYLLVVEILSAFDICSVSRLEGLDKNMIKKKYSSSFKEAEKLILNGKNFAEYRKKVAEKTPLVPSFNILSKDKYSIYEGNWIKKKPKENEPEWNMVLVNLFEPQYNIISSMKELKFPVKPDKNLQNFIFSSRTPLDDDELYTLSTTIHPSKSKVKPIVLSSEKKENETMPIPSPLGYETSTDTKVTSNLPLKRPSKSGFSIPAFFKASSDSGESLSPPKTVTRNDIYYYQNSNSNSPPEVWKKSLNISPNEKNSPTHESPTFQKPLKNSGNTPKNLLPISNSLTNASSFTTSTVLASSPNSCSSYSSCSSSSSPEPQQSHYSEKMNISPTSAAYVKHPILKPVGNKPLVIPSMKSMPIGNSVQPEKSESISMTQRPRKSSIESVQMNHETTTRIATRENEKKKVAPVSRLNLDSLSVETKLKKKKKSRSNIDSPSSKEVSEVKKIFIGKENELVNKRRSMTVNHEQRKALELLPENFNKHKHNK